MRFFQNQVLQLPLTLQRKGKSKKNMLRGNYSKISHLRASLRNHVTLSRTGP
jgi:hypothetical protein